MKKEKIKDLFDVALEGIEYIDAVLHDEAKEDPLIWEILGHLHEIAQLLETTLQNETDLLHQVVLYSGNVQASIEDTWKDHSLLARIFRLEIRPFVLEMKKLWELATNVLQNKETVTSYRQDIMQQITTMHNADPKPYKYDVSILLLAYNKLEYTRQAVESIFQYTDFSKGNIEFITLNNGSDDGTREYFESLPHTKKINLKHNIIGTFAYTHVLDGKYFIGFSNDVVATQHWLDNLLAAMQSDDHIAIAVPVCNENTISNYQEVPIPYRNTFNDMDKMQVFAAAYNHQNPMLWEDRSQLMPFIAIMRSDLIPFCAADPMYTKYEFIDDDMSTLFRRAGWRQLLLRDTFMHHFGGVTLSEGRRNKKNNFLEAMRRVYYEKWGVDAWDSRGIFPNMSECLEHDMRSDGDRVLMLEPRFGDFSCSVVNLYRRQGLSVQITAAVFDSHYLPDTNYLYDAVIKASSIDDVLQQTKESYHLISTGCYLDELPIDDVIAALEKLYALLEPNGILLLPVRNCSSAYEIWNLTHVGAWETYTGLNEVRRFSGISLTKLLTVIRKHPFLQNCYAQGMTFLEEDERYVKELLPILTAHTDDRAGIENSLQYRMVFLKIFKRESTI